MKKIIRIKIRIMSRMMKKKNLMTYMSKIKVMKMMYHNFQRKKKKTPNLKNYNLKINNLIC